tara:strand:+ start:163 stop:426 length:264 start_codon:yes stop_codon:yes gene_type:complete
MNYTDIEYKINETKLDIINYMSQLENLKINERNANNALKIAESRVEKIEQKLFDMGFKKQTDFIKNNVTKEQLDNQICIMITEGIIK